MYFKLNLKKNDWKLGSPYEKEQLVFVGLIPGDLTQHNTQISHVLIYKEGQI